MSQQNHGDDLPVLESVSAKEIKNNRLVNFLENAEEISRKNIGNFANFVIGHLGCVTSLAIGLSMGLESIAVGTALISATNFTIDKMPSHPFIDNLKECACRDPLEEKPKSIIGKMRHTYQNHIHFNARRYGLQPLTYALAGFAFGHFVMGHEPETVNENLWIDPKTNKEYIIKKQTLCSPTGATKTKIDTLEVKTFTRYQPQ